MPSVQGWRGQVRANELLLTTYRWSFDYRADIFDATNFNYFGGGQYASGLKDADVSLDCFYETSDDPFNPAARNIRPGQVIEAYLDLDATLEQTNERIIVDVLVVNVRMDVAVRDITRYSIMGKVSVYRVDAPSAPLDSVKDKRTITAFLASTGSLGDGGYRLSTIDSLP